MEGAGRVRLRVRVRVTFKTFLYAEGAGRVRVTFKTCFQISASFVAIGKYFGKYIYKKYIGKIFCCDWKNITWINISYSYFFPALVQEED